MALLPPWLPPWRWFAPFPKLALLPLLVAAAAAAATSLPESPPTALGLCSRAARSKLLRGDRWRASAAPAPAPNPAPAPGDPNRADETSSVRWKRCARAGSRDALALGADKESGAADAAALPLPDEVDRSSTFKVKSRPAVPDTLDRAAAAAATAAAACWLLYTPCLLCSSACLFAFSMLRAQFLWSSAASSMGSPPPLPPLLCECGRTNTASDWLSVSARNGKGRERKPLQHSTRVTRTVSWRAAPLPRSPRFR